MYAPVIPLLLPSLSNSTLSLIRSLWLLFSLNICECNFVLTTPKGGSSRSKTVSKGSMPQGSKRKVVGLVEDPIDEDIPATGSDIGVPPSQLANPISSHPPRAPAPKRIHLGAAGQAKPISFVPPAVKAMSSSHACTSSSSSPRVLILNDSFHMMLDYVAKHNKFPSTYDDMVAFLSEVHIQLNSNSIQLAGPYLPIHFLLNDMVFLKQRLEHPGNSFSLASCCRRVQWTLLLQSIQMVCLSQEFPNSHGNFQFGICRFRTLSSSPLVSVKAIFTTTGHYSYSNLTTCKSRRRS